MQVVKNKVGPPYKTADYDFMFASGVNSQGCLLDVAEALNLASKKVWPLGFGGNPQVGWEGLVCCTGTVIFADMAACMGGV